MKSRILTIYFPQFHTIPENDEWWGKGFTEWTNVRRGKAYYPGHYQPREPFHDNYYDLSDLKVLEKHTRMARRAGIAGFCFYHYYFCGKTLLEKPIEEYRDYSQETFPYCLIWANETWSRTWYRSNAGGKVLLRQVYGNKDDWEKHFQYLLKFFRDERYIKINNKPIYIIYIPQDIPVRRQMFEYWQMLAKENGFNGLYLIAMNTSRGKDKSKKLYDAYMNFEPMCTLHNDDSYRSVIQAWKKERIDNIVPDKKTIRNALFMNNTFSYSYVCKQIEKKGQELDENTYAGVFTGWDNTARKDEEGIIIPRSSPKRFGKNIKKMLMLAEKQNKKFVFLNAWNEWSEGPYIEPDKKYGYAYLNELRQAIRCYEKHSKRRKK